MDLIQIPKERKRAQEFFDIKKALMIGFAGNLNYAEDLLSDLGVIAQQTGNREIEGAVDEALTSLVF